MGSFHMNVPLQNLVHIYKTLKKKKTILQVRNDLRTRSDLVLRFFQDDIL